MSLSKRGTPSTASLSASSSLGHSLSPPRIERYGNIIQPQYKVPSSKASGLTKTLAKHVLGNQSLYEKRSSTTQLANKLTRNAILKHAMNTTKR